MGSIPVRPSDSADHPSLVAALNISDEIHPDFRAQAETVLGALEQAYPHVKVGEVRLYDKPGDRSMAYTDGSDIFLNAYWFAHPAARLSAAARLGREAAPYGLPLWHGGMRDVGDNQEPAFHLFVHEFGHLLMAVTPGAKAFAQRQHALALSDPSIAVSGYALSDDPGECDEWWAETFAAMRIGAPSPQVAEMAAFLAEHGA